MKATFASLTALVVLAVVFQIELVVPLNQAIAHVAEILSEVTR